MFEVVEDIDDDGIYTASIFGERFRLSADVNGWLLTMAAGGDMGALRKMVDASIVVEPKEGERLAVARRRESDRFHDNLSQRDHFSVEDAMELVACLMEAAGNDPEE